MERIKLRVKELEQKAKNLKQIIASRRLNNSYHGLVYYAIKNDTTQEILEVIIKNNLPNDNETVQEQKITKTIQENLIYQIKRGITLRKNDLDYKAFISSILAATKPVREISKQLRGIQTCLRALKKKLKRIDAYSLT